MNPRAAVTPSADGASLGRLEFPETGSAECQRQFRDGMLAVHSFLYDQAHESFAAAAAADPHCAMAAWGDAMAYDHPVWGERDLAKGRAALARVNGDDALTAKERAYVGAARALYASDDLKQAHLAWLAAAAAMHEAYPNDDEVLLQHALALLSVYGYDSLHLREQMEGGALALAVFAHNPEHPGAAHYAIHAFDNPEHAVLALPAASAYARIAPAGFHALHMPSHIFTQLGMWREVVPSNEQAYAVSVAWAKAHGQTPSHYDWHSYSWTVAARLELGEAARAKKLVDDAGALLAGSRDDSSTLRGAYISMVTDYVTQTGRWGEVESLVAPVFALAFDEGGGSGGAEGNVACAMHAPGARGDVRLPSVLWARLDAQELRAEAAIRARDEGLAVKRVADMKSVRVQMAPWAAMLSPAFVARQDANVEALLARAHAAASPSAASRKKATDALVRLETLESRESSGGPAFERPASEALGDALLGDGHAKEALAAFERDLQAHPKRALGLLGAARAAKASGDANKARQTYAALGSLWGDADADLPALAEVRAASSGSEAVAEAGNASTTRR